MLVAGESIQSLPFPIEKSFRSYLHLCSQLFRSKFQDGARFPQTPPAFSEALAEATWDYGTLGKAHSQLSHALSTMEIVQTAS